MENKDGALLIGEFRGGEWPQPPVQVYHQASVAVRYHAQLLVQRE